MKNPKSKIQNPNKLQTPNFKWSAGVVELPARAAVSLSLYDCRLSSSVLEFGFWNLFGIWNLGFGISARS
jgi:hypothetical protein